MITLIADASFGGPNCAGWAAWYKGDGGIGPHFVSGAVVRFPCAYPSDAELAALFFGVEAVQHIRGHHRIMLQSDCQRALRMLRWRFDFGESRHPEGLGVGCDPLKPNPQELAVLDAWSALERRLHRFDVVVRHVKGHTKRAMGWRYWVNRRCDELAGNHMLQQRRANSELG